MEEHIKAGNEPVLYWKLGAEETKVKKMSVSVLAVGNSIDWSVMVARMECTAVGAETKFVPGQCTTAVVVMPVKET